MISTTRPPTWNEPMSRRASGSLVCAEADAAASPNARAKPKRRMAPPFHSIERCDDMTGARSLDQALPDQPFLDDLGDLGIVLVDASEPAAVPHQQRQLAFAVPRQEILHVHLLDHVLAVGIELRLRTAGLAHDHPHRLAADLGDPAADMERTQAAQHDVVLSRERRKSG